MYVCMYCFYDMFIGLYLTIMFWRPMVGFVGVNLNLSRGTNVNCLAAQYTRTTYTKSVWPKISKNLTVGATVTILQSMMIRFNYRTHF